MAFSVIIPSKNAANLEPCVGAIRAAGEDCRIIVVDDGLARRPQTCEYIDGVKPFIFARNVNLGIAAAGKDDVILLNDDALLQTPAGFSALAKVSAAHPLYGVIAATCNRVGNKSQWPQGLGLRDEPRMVCFVCVYIPRYVLELVGWLDERFVGYGYDDDDYCLRVRLAGMQIGIYDGCYVDHGSLRSTFRGDPARSGDLKQNLQIFKEKWGMDNWGTLA